MRNILRFPILRVFSCVIILASCHHYGPAKKLNPEEQEFLSKVRFIITKKERKAFLRIPSSKREAFIEEFWKIRDPDPQTEENEYKIEYFSRIETANRLFRGEGFPGWLTDRGRVYILFGPPFSRKTFPADIYRGIRRAREVWYYGNFPVIFIDTYSSGVYRLTTTNLEALNEINFALRKVNRERKKQISEASELLLDFNLEFKSSTNIPVALLKVPYKKIWFQQKEDILETTLTLDLKILDPEGKIIIRHNEDYVISLTEESLEDNIDEDYRIEIPFILAKGEYVARASLTNKTGSKEVLKEFKFKL